MLVQHGLRWLKQNFLWTVRGQVKILMGCHTMAKVKCKMC